MAKILKAPRPPKEKKDNPIEGLPGMKGVNTGLAGLTPEQLQAIQLANNMLLQNKYLNLGTTGGHSSYTEAVGTEDTTAARFGDSKYDNTTTYNSDPSIINEQRFNLQDGWDVFGNSLAKATGSFTTATLAAVGTISNLIFQGLYSDSDSVGEYISKAATEGLNKHVWQLDNWVRNNTEIYRSAEQKANDWHDAVNIFSGTTVGMFADLLGFATSAALTGGLAGSGFAAVGMSARGAGLAGSLVASLGEASIEAGHTKKEYTDKKTKELYSMAEAEYNRIATSEMYTPAQKQEALKQLEFKLANTLQGIEEQSRTLGNATFLLNTAILSVGNFIHFGKYIGIKKAIQEEQAELVATYARKVAAGEWTKKQYKQAVKKLDKQAAAKALEIQDAAKFTLEGNLAEEGAKYINKESKRHVLQFLKNTSIEGFEEMNQRVISEAEKKYRDKELDYIVKNKYKGATEADNPSFLSSLVESAIDTYTDEEAWQEFALGFIGGGIGTPTVVRNSEGKFRPKWVGSGFQSVSESKKRFADTQAIVDELNEYIKSDKFQEEVRDFRRLEAIRREKEEAIIESDLPRLEELEHREFMIAAVTLAKHGRLGDLKHLYSQRMTEEQASELISRTTQITEDGKLEGLFVDPNMPTETRDPSEVAKEINERNQKRLDIINKLGDTFNLLSREFKDILSKEEIADLVAANMISMHQLDNAREAVSNFVSNLFISQNINSPTLKDNSPLYKELLRVKDILSNKADRTEDQVLKDKYTRQSEKIQEFLDIMSTLSEEAGNDTDTTLTKLLERNTEKVKKAEEARKKLEEDKDNLSEEEIEQLQEDAEYTTDVLEAFKGVLKLIDENLNDNSDIEKLSKEVTSIYDNYAKVINSFLKHRGAERTFELLKIKAYARKINQEAQEEEETKNNNKKKESKVDEFLDSPEFNYLLSIGDHNTIKEKLNNLSITEEKKKKVNSILNEASNRRKYEFRTNIFNFIDIWRNEYNNKPSNDLFSLISNLLSEENINSIIQSSNKNIIENFLKSFNDTTSVSTFLYHLLQDEWSGLDDSNKQALINVATEIINKIKSLGGSTNTKTSNADSNTVDELYKYALEVLKGNEPVEGVDKNTFKNALDELAFLSSPEDTLKEYIKQYLDNVNDLEKYKRSNVDTDFRTLVDILEKIHNKLIQSKQAQHKPTQKSQEEEINNIIKEIKDLLTKNNLDIKSLHGLDKVDLGTLKNFKQLLESSDLGSLGITLFSSSVDREDGTTYLSVNVSYDTHSTLKSYNNKEIDYTSTLIIYVDDKGIKSRVLEYYPVEYKAFIGRISTLQDDDSKLDWLVNEGYISQNQRNTIKEKLDKEGLVISGILPGYLTIDTNTQISSIPEVHHDALHNIIYSGNTLVDIRYSKRNNTNSGSNNNTNTFSNNVADSASTTITEFIEENGVFTSTQEGNAPTNAIKLIRLTGGFEAVSTGQIPQGAKLKIYRSIPEGFNNIDSDPVLKEYRGKDIKNHKGENVAVLGYTDANGNLIIIDIVSDYILNGITQLLTEEHKEAWSNEGTLLIDPQIEVIDRGNSSIPFHKTDYRDLSTRYEDTLSMEESLEKGLVVPAFINGMGEIVVINSNTTVDPSLIIRNDSLSLDEGKILFLYKQADGNYYPAIGAVKRLSLGDSSLGVYVGANDTSNNLVNEVRSSLTKIVADNVKDLVVGDNLNKFKEELLETLNKYFFITSDLSIEILHSDKYKDANGNPITTISISTPHSNVNAKSDFNRMYITITNNGNTKDTNTIVSELMSTLGSLGLPLNVSQGLSNNDIVQRTSVNTEYNRAVNGRLYYRPNAVSYDGNSYTLVTNENPDKKSNGISTGLNYNSNVEEVEEHAISIDNNDITLRISLQGNRLLNSRASYDVHIADLEGNITTYQDNLTNSARRAVVLSYLLKEGRITEEEAYEIVNGFSEGNATLDYTGPKDFHVIFSDSSSSAHIMVKDGKLYVIQNKAKSRKSISKESDTVVEGGKDFSSEMFDNLKNADDPSVTITDTSYQIKEEGNSLSTEFKRVTSLTQLNYTNSNDFTVLREMGNFIENFVVNEIKKHFNNNVPVENLHPIVRDLLLRFEGYKFVQDKKLLYGNIKVNGEDTNVAGVPDLIFYNEDTKRVAIIDVKTFFQNYVPGYNILYNSDNFGEVYEGNTLSKSDSYRSQLLRYRQLLINNLGINEDQVALYILPIKWNTLSKHTSSKKEGNHYSNINVNSIKSNDLVLDINTISYNFKVSNESIISNDRESAGLLPIAYDIIGGNAVIPGDTKSVETTKPKEGINTAQESADTIKSALDDLFNRSSSIIAQDSKDRHIDIKRELRWLASRLPNVNKQMALAIYNRVFTIASSGVEVYGMYKNGVIYLAENGPAGTLYHEAFHAVYRTLLTEEERLAVYEELKELYPDKTPLQIEEILAEKFAEYTMGLTYDDSLKGRIIRFFRMIKEMLNNFLKINSEMDRLFYNIHSGKYGERDTGINRETAVSTIYDLRGLEFSNGIAPTIININGKPVKVVLEGSSDIEINPMEEMKNNRATIHSDSVIIAPITNNNKFDSFRDTHNGVYHNGKVTIYKESARAVKLVPNKLSGSIELLNSHLNSSNVSTNTLDKLNIPKKVFNELPIEVQENILFCN